MGDDAVAAVRRMVLPELRTALRERGLSPAGGIETLKDRLSEAILSGAAPPAAVPAPGQPASAVGVMAPTEARNDYVRPGGQQNVGNFITGRASSRVLAPPGGGSSISLADAAPTTAFPQQQPARQPAPMQPPPVHQSPPPQSQQGDVLTIRRGAGDKLGLGVEEAPQGGLLMSSPTPGSIAEAVGACNHVGRAITHINGIPVQCMEDLAACVQDALVVHVTLGAPAGVVSQPQAPAPAPAHGRRSAEPPQAGQGVTNNYHRSGGQQNVGNFMTGRSTSRVLAPPGGGSSVSLTHCAAEGGYTSPPRAHRVQQPPPQPQQPPPQAPAPGPAPVGAAAGGVTNNYHRAGGQQNVGNFITGRSTSRVLAPPGGGSSLTLY